MFFPYRIQWRIQAFRIRGGAGRGKGHPHPEIRRGRSCLITIRIRVWFKNKGGGRAPRAPPLDLYLFHFSTSTFLLSTTWVRTCLLLRLFVFCSHRGEPETRLTGEEAPKFSSRFPSRDVFVRGSVRTVRTGLGRRHRFGRRPKPPKKKKKNF